jgi:hypothetical protein
MQPWLLAAYLPIKKQNSKRMIEINKRATVAEATDIANDVSNAVVGANIDDTYLTGENNTLQTKSQEMTSGIGAEKANKYTADRDGQDVVRDDELTAFIYFLRAYQLWPIEANQAAANRLMRIVDNHGGNFSKESREKESGLYDALLLELAKEAPIADLNQLQLLPLVNDMRAAEAEYKRLDLLVAAENGGKVGFVAPSKLKGAVLAQIDAIVNYLDSMSKAKPETYKVLATNVTTMIEALNQKIRRHENTKPNNPDEGEKQ